MALSVIAPGYVSGMGFSGWRRSEDFLTGEFFGLLRYLPVQMGVLPVLARAEFRGATFGNWLAATGGQRAARMRIALWPEFEDGGIPDVLIQIADERGSPIADVLVEVKLYSGQSERQGFLLPQLARYMNAFPTSERFSIAKSRALIYLTLDRSCPSEELERTCGDAAAVRLFWLGWYDVAAVLRTMAPSGPADDVEGNKLIIRDLQGVLRARGIRVDAELESFPFQDAEPLPDLSAWLESWSLARGGPHGARS